MFEDDRTYCQHRAEVKIKRAQSATLLSVDQAHYRPAKAYLNKISTDEPVKVDAS